MKKILSLVLVAMMLFSASLRLSADDNTNYGDWSGTTNGDALTLNKYLVMSESVGVPEVTFTYTVSLPGDTEGDVLFPGDEEHPIIYVGVQLAKVKVIADTAAGNYLSDTQKFGATDTQLAHDDVADEGDHVKEGDVFVKKTFQVDFSEVEFTEPGIYRYYLQESSNNGVISNDIEVTGDGNTWRTIDVYVTNVDPNDPKSELQFNYVVYEGKLEGTAEDAPKKEIDTASTYNDSSFKIEDREILIGTTWEYTDTTASPYVKYSYQYKESERPSEGWEWEETRENLETNVKDTQRNLTTHLTDSYGVPKDSSNQPIEYVPEDWKEAIAMGAEDTVLQGTKWTYTDPNTGAVHNYEYVSGAWKHTSVWTDPVQVMDPVDDATPTTPFVLDSANNTSSTITYKEAKEGVNQTYYDAALVDYDWEYSPQTGTVDTYVYDPATDKWSKTTTINDDETPHVDAIPETPFAVSPIKYTYVLDDEKKKAKEEYIHDNAGTGAEAGEKTDNYVNKYLAHAITVSKEVTGNQGSKDKYFKFTIKISNGGPNTAMILDNSGMSLVSSSNIPTGKEDSAPNDATDPSYTYTVIVDANSRDDDSSGVDGNQVTTDADGNATIVVYLRSGDQVVISGVKEGASYTVKEFETNKDGYVTTVEVTGDDRTEEQVIKYEYDGTTYDTLAAAEAAAENANDDNPTITEVPQNKYYYNEVEYPTFDDAKEAALQDNASEDDVVTVPVLATVQIKQIENDDDKDVKDSALMSDALVAYTNDRSGVIPTGVVVSVAGGAALVGLATIGLIVLNRKKDEDEE